MEGLLYEKKPAFWKSTLDGKIYREKFIQAEGYRQNCLIHQDKDLKELIIALIASNHNEFYNTEMYSFNKETLSDIFTQA